MKKWYAIGLLVIALALASAFVAACGEEEVATDDSTEVTETTEAMTDMTETTEAMTEDTEAEAAGGIPAEVDTNTLGIYMIDNGDMTVSIWDVPAPGMAFPVHNAAESDDDFAMVIAVLDADGNVLGELDTMAGLVDYSAYADTAAKITVTNKAGEEVKSLDLGM